jgi:hypothetical protein
MTAYRYGRLRYSRRMTSREKAAAAVAALVLAGAGQGAARAVHHARTTAAPIPDASSYTPASWARAFLGAIGEPETACNLAAVRAWEAAEGGAWGNSATANPLNTTYDASGAWEAAGKVTATINSDGVRAFDSWRTGLIANVTVIRNGLYSPVLSALSAGNNAQAVADAVASSPWGTGRFSASC